jgi:hypothetical protein
MGRFEMMLPAGSALVQRQDLRCVNDAAYSAVVISPSKDTCLAMYALDTPGRYRVVVEYFGPEVNLASVTPGRVSRGGHRPMEQGVHLADSATFVIVRR